MIKIYNKELTNYEEVSEETFNDLLSSGKIDIKERFVEHHVIPQEQKREGKTAQQVYQELLAQGVNVRIHKGIYCKIVDKTYEAINPISAIDDYDEYEEVYAYVE